MMIRALVFDAYGTLYDVHSVYAKTEELCPGRGDLITQIWRLKQLEYTWLQTVGGHGPMAGQNHHFSQYAAKKIPYAIDSHGC